MSAGGPSPYGTMGQGGNVIEWNETDPDFVNNSPSSLRLSVAAIGARTPAHWQGRACSAICQYPVSMNWVFASQVFLNQIHFY